VTPAVAVKRSVAWGLLRTGLLSLHRLTRERSRAAILLYHRVNDDADPFFPALGVGHFVAQLEYLARRYRVEPLETVLDWLAEGAVGPGRVAITIDDGYPDTHDVVLPVLARLGLPATLFLCTAPPETSRPAWTDRARAILEHARRSPLRLPDLGLHLITTDSPRSRLAACVPLLQRLKQAGPATISSTLARMEQQLDPAPHRLRVLSWDEVRRISRGPVTLGAHTHNHYLLAHLDPAQLRSEVSTSVDLIEERVGSRPHAFAYPNGQDGDFDARSIRVFQDLGLRCALSSRHGMVGPQSDRWQLPRVYTSGTSLALFATRVGGLGIARGSRVGTTPAQLDVL